MSVEKIFKPSRSEIVLARKNEAKQTKIIISAHNGGLRYDNGCK